MLGDLVADGVAGRAAGEDGEEENFGVGEVFADFEDDGADAFGDFAARCCRRCCWCRS